jgi:serine/threonine protein kinase
MTEEALFHDARELPPAERAAWLAEHSPDLEMRRRVDELLAAHDRGGPLDAPPHTNGFADPAASAGADPAAEPRQIGPYRRLMLIGEGGMGEVWLAEQAEPIRRQVALKLIKAGMDSREVVARFEAERQALALMDHPNIAKVFDAGTTEAGRPYFVMELIQGERITSFCDEQHLTPTERLRLLIEVCHAVQHAHQKGVIHRDLKPSNVLVALLDGKPVPKVIDFGVAKAVRRRLTDHTTFTEVGAVVGTLEYMAPEQAESAQRDVDTRSDVYSLGVLLYELLAGTPPFDRRRLRSAALQEVLRIIREEDPPKPSTRLSGSAELTDIAARRRTEPAKLSRLVKGDLDWIVMKALEKDRSRRYDSAAGLARDLQRYLADEPVEACPPSAAYRLRKFVRRHKAVAAAAAVAVLAVAVAVTGLTVGLVQARRAEARAKIERDRADRNYQRARQAVDTYLQKVSQNPQLTRGDFLALRRDLLSAAVPFLEEFVREKSDDPTVLCEQGLACLQLGLVQADLGDHAAAAGDYAAARDIYRRLVADNPGYAGHRYKLAGVCNNLSNELATLGRRAESDEALTESVRVKEQLAADFPDDVEFRRFVAVGYHNRASRLTDAGRLAEAEEVYRRALAIRERLAADDPRALHRSDLAFSYHGLAQVKRMLGDGDTAEGLYRRAYDLRRQLVDTDTRERDGRYEFAKSACELGALLGRRGRTAEAEEKLIQSVAIFERLAAEFPAVPAYRVDLDRARGDLAQFRGDRADTIK